MINDIALNEGVFDAAYTILRAEIAKSIRDLYLGGFSNLWKRELENLYKLKAMQLSPMRLASPYISPNTLSPFFYTIGIILVLLGVIILAEILSDETIRGTLWDKGRCFKHLKTLFVFFFNLTICR